MQVTGLQTQTGLGLGCSLLGLRRCPSVAFRPHRAWRHSAANVRLARSEVCDTHGRRRLHLQCAAAAAPVVSKKLADLELTPILNLQGLIQPEVPPNTEGSVFAIFDDNKKLQFVGFSKDLRNSLRTVFSRRPEKAFFFKAVHLGQMDQDEMLGIRAAWFEEVGGPPTGNKLAMERTAWSQPVSAGAISQRGKQAAAESKVLELMALIRSRGCKEDFEPNPQLLSDGQVDFLATRALSEEELQAQREEQAAQARAKRIVHFQIDGANAEFDLFVAGCYNTNGGAMLDLMVTYEDKETTHRLIVGREYYEPFAMDAAAVAELVFAFLLEKKVPRQTEGMLLSSQFPVNYFSVSEVDQFFPDFQAYYAATGRVLPGDGKFWRFNRLHNYGGKDENLESLSLAIRKS